MDICGILVVVYFIVGIILTLYWFKTDYAESYKSSVEDGTEEKGMTCIFLLKRPPGDLMWTSASMTRWKTFMMQSEKPIIRC